MKIYRESHTFQCAFALHRIVQWPLHVQLKWLKCHPSRNHGRKMVHLTEIVPNLSFELIYFRIARPQQTMQ